MKALFFVPVVLLGSMAALAASARSEALGWYTTLEGSKVVPPVTTSYAGIAYFGLSGSQLSCLLYSTVNHGTARIHVGAPGTNGPVLAIIPVDAVGAWFGKITLDATQLANLEAGLLYAEITALLSPDKVRGQLTPSYAKEGTGCPGAVGIPSLSGTGVAKLGGTIFMQASKGVPGGLGLIFASLMTAELPMSGGCFFLVDPIQPLILPIPFGPTGAWSSGPLLLPATLPVEVPIHMQLLTSDSGAPNGVFGASVRLSMNVFAY